MGRFLPYEPDQACLVPPSVKDELGEDHLCFFIHQAVEHVELKSFEQVYGEEGGALYCPALMLKVWLYAYAVGITSARRLEQRIREDLGLRYLAGGAGPDNWGLSAFRRRHARGLNERLYLPSDEDDAKEPLLATPETPMLWDSSHVTRRVAAQRSRFMILGTDPSWLVKIEKVRRSRLVSISIPRGSINRIRQELKDAGVTESVVYPDLDGLGRELKQIWKTRR